jgi:hypothetical protein
MIDPQPGQRSVIGEQHGLARLTSTLEALSQGQTQQRTRDTHLQEQLTTQAQQLARLTTRGQRLFRAVLGLGVLTLGLSGLVGWQVRHPPDMAYARALGALDTALVQQWSSLPKAAQESFSVTYGRLGLASPGERQRK